MDITENERDQIISENRFFYENVLPLEGRLPETLNNNDQEKMIEWRKAIEKFSRKYCFEKFGVRAEILTAINFQVVTHYKR